MNSDLHTAKTNKKDEFYTSIEDIEKEIPFYEPAGFLGKVMLLPCDTASSSFWKFFCQNFKKLGLYKLICSSISGEVFIYDGTSVTSYTPEDGGDFRSKHVQELMQSSDIIVTNPPFSLFREFYSLVRKNDKKFIILGNVNAITYREVFPDIVSGITKLGASIHSGDREFLVPDDYPLEGTACRTDGLGRKFIRVKGVRWFTNMRFTYDGLEPVVLENKYSKEHYPKYDTYDAINVNSGKEIPYDYEYAMGVPITVLDRADSHGDIKFLAPDGTIIRFRMFGMLNSGNGKNCDYAKPVINGNMKFKRILIIRQK